MTRSRAPRPGSRRFVFACVLASSLASAGLALAGQRPTASSAELGAGFPIVSAFAWASDGGALRTLWLIVASAFFLFADAALAGLETSSAREWSRRGAGVALAGAFFVLFGGSLVARPRDPSTVPQILLSFAFAHAMSRIVLGAGLPLDGWARIGVRIVATAFVFPLTARWVWSAGGWLSELPWGGFHDFGGGAVVHLAGAMVVLAGLLVLGAKADDIPPPAPSPSSAPAAPTLTSLGSALLWYGWQAFTPGGDAAAANASHLPYAAITATLAGCGGAWVGFLYTAWHTGRWEIGRGLQGMTAGLVAAAAGSDAFTPFGGLFVGVVGGACFVSVRQLLGQLGHVDPREILAMHGAPALWGTLAVGLFRAEGVRGLLYGGTVDALVVQLVGIVAIACAALASGLVLMAFITSVRPSQHRAKARS